VGGVKVLFVVLHDSDGNDVDDIGDDDGGDGRDIDMLSFFGMLLHSIIIGSSVGMSFG
jgi:hypothetical protein